MINQELQEFNEGLFQTAAKACTEHGVFPVIVLGLMIDKKEIFAFGFKNEDPAVIREVLQSYIRAMEKEPNIHIIAIPKK